MITSGKPIDTPRFAERLRERAIDLANQRILVSRLAGSDQEVDISAPTNCNGFGRIRHFRIATSPSWPNNPLPIIPACKALGIKTSPQLMQAQVFQNAACAWRCWYCFVPENLLKADLKRSEWFTSEELVRLYISESDRPLVIDLSGGSPDLVPEWTPWMMQALRTAGLDGSTYLWTDDNLSTTYLFDRLSSMDMDLLLSYRNYGRVCCFKGYDARSFAYNTRASSGDFDRQFQIMARLLNFGLDLYGYVTLTSPYTDFVKEGVRDFVDRLQLIDPNLPLRIVPLRIQVFTPVNARLDPNRERSLAVQDEAVAAWTTELARRFDGDLLARPITDVPLQNGRGHL